MDGPHHLRPAGCLLLIAAFWLVSLAASIGADNSVTLGWNPNSEPDLQGYALYFREDAAGPPFDYVDWIDLNELDDPDFPTARLAGLQDGTEYNFMVTAYDTEGLESGFSNAVCVRFDAGTMINCTPRSSSDDNGGGGGSGGGGGCFVSSAISKNSEFFQKWSSHP